jgi:RHS repeat-associated protein
LAPPWIWWWGALPVRRGRKTFCGFSDPTTDDDKGQLTLLVHEKMVPPRPPSAMNDSMEWCHASLDPVRRCSSRKRAVADSPSSQPSVNLVSSVVQCDPQGNPPSVDDAFSTDSYANRYLSIGREFLKEANLDDYRNRVYSAELGRFLKTDPIRFDAVDGNLYRNVGNRSSLLIDPMGHYVTYTCRGSQAFWDNYRKQYDELYKTKTGKRQIEEMENSDQEYVIDLSQQGQRIWSVANKVFLIRNLTSLVMKFNRQ